MSPEELASAYSEKVHRFAAMVSRGDQDSADLAQEALLRAIRALPRFDPARGSMDAWLWRIVVNCCRDAGRVSRRRLALFDQLQRVHQASADAEREALRKLTDHELLEAVRALSPRYRTLIALRYGAGLSYAEIARQVGTTERAAIMAVRRALIRLRQRLEVTR
ncbi:MAG: RNA polymerase sigma factor [Candidatus Dormibacteria bacterium]